jgi:hypothetical protein
MPRKLNKSRTARVIRDIENGVFATNITVTSLSASGDLSALTGTVHFITSSHVCVDNFIIHNGDDDTYINFTDDRIRFNAGGINLFGMHQKSSAPHQVTVNNGGNNVDFVINDDDSTTYFRADASTTRIGIGIGDNAPDESLHVGGNLKVAGDDARVKIDGDSNSHPGVELYENGTRKWIVFNDYTNDNLTFKTNDDIRMSIGQDGQVGIGTTDPDLGSADGLHILSTTGQGQGNLRVECTEATIDQYQSLINCQWPNDTSIDNENYWVKFVNGSGQVGAIHSEVTYGPFTGCHYTTVPSGSIRLGMVLKSTGETFFKRGIGNAWVITEATTTEKDKAVAGVYSGLVLPAEESVIGEELAAYNAVGEGSVLVTDAGGNIETGDYICSSNNLGHGMKQDDDLLHNYTVAKANEPIDFSTVEVDPELGFKSFLLACTYHCG